MFKTPKVRQAEKPTPPPTIDDAARNEEFSRKLARRRGRVAMLRRGASATPSVAVKALLG